MLNFVFWVLLGIMPICNACSAADSGAAVGPVTPPVEQEKEEETKKEGDEK